MKFRFLMVFSSFFGVFRVGKARPHHRCGSGRLPQLRYWVGVMLKYWWNALEKFLGLSYPTR